MATYYDDRLNKKPWWNINTPTTRTPEEAQQRLDAILSDKLLWFNPYRVPDRQLLECAERAYWLPFPSLTQMLVYHFSDIRHVSRKEGYSYYGLFFRVGNNDNEHHFGTSSLTHPITHTVTRQSVWTLINDRHLVESNIRTLEGKDCFISHAINGIKMSYNSWPALRMYRLSGSELRRAATVRKSMVESKIAMLNEVLNYPIHPDYLGNACYTIDYRSPILRTIDAIKSFPTATPSTTHII